MIFLKEFCYSVKSASVWWPAINSRHWRTTMQHEDDENMKMTKHDYDADI